MYKRDMTDFELVDYLRRKDAIHDWVSIESPAINEYWRGSDLIAIVVFDNANMRKVIYTCDMG